MTRTALPLPPGTRWIATAPDLARTVREFREAGEVAFDTEADSYYVYHVKVCLLQASTRERHYLIDPLADLDLAPLGEVFADRAVLKVWHAGSNDVGLLRHLYGFDFHHQFDTMLASQVLGLRRPGLASLLEERFDVKQSKAYQTSDWRKRPLTEGQLHYAVTDTAHLLDLRDELRQELEEKGRLEEAEEEFERLAEANYTPRVFDEDAFWRVRGARDLDSLGRRVLAELYRFREEEASRRDCSPHRVMPDRMLVDLAHVKPTAESRLRKMRGLPPRVLERHGSGVMKAVREALELGPLRRDRPQRNARNAPTEPPLNERQKACFEALRQWRRQRAEERDVDESRIATTGTLRSVAREAPEDLEALGSVVGITPFRLREYGAEILEVVRSS